MIVEEYLKYLPNDVTIMIESFVKKRNKAIIPGFNFYQGDIKGVYVYKNLLNCNVLVVSVEIVPKTNSDKLLLYHLYIE